MSVALTLGSLPAAEQGTEANPTTTPVPAPPPAGRTTLTATAGLCYCGQMVGGFEALFAGRTIEVDFIFHSTSGRPNVKIFRTGKTLPLDEGVKLVCSWAEAREACGVTGAEVSLTGTWTDDLQFHAEEIVLPAQLAQRKLPEGSTVLDADANCRVYKPNLKSSETVRWSGACKEGLAEGEGVAAWFNDLKPTVKFQGMFRAGKLQGKGAMTGADGDEYRGDYKDGMRHGVGVYVSAKGERYEGPYENNLRHGMGALIDAAGNRVEVEFKNGVRIGAPPPPLAAGNAARCDANFRVLGNVAAQLQSYDELARALSEAKDPLALLNGFIATQGLLIDLFMDEEAKGFPDRLERDGPSGRKATVFLKTLRVDDGSGFGLDEMIETENGITGKKLRGWKVEAEADPPLAMQGEELIFQRQIGSPCGSTPGFTAYIAIKPDGSLRAVAKQAWPAPSELSKDACTANKHIQSSFVACKRYIDKSKKRWLIYEYPIA